MHTSPFGVPTLGSSLRGALAAAVRVVVGADNHLGGKRQRRQHEAHHVSRRQSRNRWNIRGLLHGKRGFNPLGDAHSFSKWRKENPMPTDIAKRHFGRFDRSLTPAIVREIDALDSE